MKNLFIAFLLMATCVSAQKTTCLVGKAQYQLSANGVRAHLSVSTDIWRNPSSSDNYVVPNVLPGLDQQAISSLFWGRFLFAGKNENGNLYFSELSNSPLNYWTPGPIYTDGQEDYPACKYWDRHFAVKGRDVRDFIFAYENSGTGFDCAHIPLDILTWPAKGNPYFKDLVGVNLPVGQDLAPFFDRDEDGLYNPCLGDYPQPIIKGKPCGISSWPEELVFYVIKRLDGDQVGFEVQVQAFVFASFDQIDKMSFVQYKVINRGGVSLDSVYIGLISDSDLGCPQDDYLGCNSNRNLAYVYNQDNIDGISGSACTDSYSYGVNIPIMGIDFLGGVQDNYNGSIDPITGTMVYDDLGLSSFMAYANGGIVGFPPATSDPQVASEYYNYLTGRWRDGTPLTYGGVGYNPGSTDTVLFVYPDAPNDPLGWSMSSGNYPGFDGRMVQSSGPFQLHAGQSNEIVIGLPWVADQDYPNPSLAELFYADDMAQNLYEDDFNFFRGPDAPELIADPHAGKIVFEIANHPASNNVGETYEAVDPLAPLNATDPTYNFEGYLIYQLRDASVTYNDWGNSERMRLVHQCDKSNNVAAISNWVADTGADGSLVFNEVEQVVGSNQGIDLDFEVTTDLFDEEGDNTLQNYKPYYYMAFAYAHNNWQTYNPTSGAGQKRSFLMSPARVGRGQSAIVMVTPAYDSIVEADVQITRIEGVGSGFSFLEVPQATRLSFLTPNHNGQITYKQGQAPIKVIIPAIEEAQLGEYELTIADANMMNDSVETDAYWVLKQLSTGATVTGAESIESLNEQAIDQFGFSVIVGTLSEPGVKPWANMQNGKIGMSLEYMNAEGPKWLTTITDGLIPFHFDQSQLTQPFYLKDPNQQYEHPENLFVPYQITSCVSITNVPVVFGPSWSEGYLDQVIEEKRMRELNNVDIVFTKDTALWSRCVIVETTNSYFYEDLDIETEGNKRNFDVRSKPSVGKTDADGDGFPDPDGAIETFAPIAGQPLTGMGWFPGYAVDVETGKRLNIFFGEASAYRAGNFSMNPNMSAYLAEHTEAHDMAWNPSSQLKIGQANELINEIIAGGQHYIFVSNTRYDGCDSMRLRLSPLFGTSNLRKISELRKITWAGFPMLHTDQALLPYNQGLIPNDCIVKLRVHNAYGHQTTTSSVHNGYPTYRISIDTTLVAVNELAVNNDFIISPNPVLVGQDLKISGLNRPCFVSIINLIGQPIVDRLPVTGAESVVISTQNLVPGLYIVQIETDNLEQQSRIIFIR